MYCKKCGTALAPSEKFCPSCGTMNSKAGGNGFWDIAKTPESAAAPAAERERPEKTESKQKPSLLLLAFCVLCAAALLISFAAILSANRRIKSLEWWFSQEIIALNDANAERFTALEQQIEALREEDEEIKELNIVIAPNSTSRRLGDNLPVVFDFQLEGKVQYFVWAKQTENGDWLPLRFSAGGICEEYGLLVNDEPERGLSRLIVYDIKESSFGTYRCTACGENSGVQTVTVQLIQEMDAEENAPVQTAPRQTTAVPTPQKTQPAPATPAPTVPDPEPETPTEGGGIGENDGGTGEESGETGASEEAGESGSGAETPDGE